MPILTNSKDFIRNEFTNVQLGDERLSKRLVKIVETVNNAPLLSLPTMTDSEKSQLKGIYRFFQNTKVSEDKILQTHYVNTVERMESYKGKILLLNDSCFVRPAKKMDGLLTRGKGKENCVRVHYCLAISEDGKHLFGILDFHVLTDPISKKYPDLRDESDIWLKTAENCLNHIYGASIRGEKLLSRCLFIADREGDEFELMKFLSENGLGFIIRSQYNRKVEFEGKQSKLLEVLKGAEEHGSPYNVSTKKQNTICTVSVQRSVVNNISVIDPSTYTKASPLLLNMVVVREKDNNEDPLEWRLWTTEDVDTIDSSEFVVTAYTHRWKIEEVNKGAKTGVRIEKRQFTDVNHLIPFLAMSFVIAWRIVALRTVAEISPDEKIEEAFEENEIEYLKSAGKEKKMKMSTVQDAISYIARLGGFLRTYERPGWQILWQGWMRFYERVEGFKLAKRTDMSDFFEKKCGFT